MSRIAYVNGQYVRHAEAGIHIEDRGYQFSDGVYEVCAIRGGRLLDEDWHLERLQRSLRELRIGMPMGLPALRHVLRQVMRRNGLRNGMLYLQVTRGVAPRDHAFPPAAVAPSIVITAKRINETKLAQSLKTGVAVITTPDLRWARRDIKSVSLLPNVLAKQQAKDAGAYEALLVDPQGFITEGSSSNVWIVDGEGRLVTRPSGNEILNGVTRRVLIEIAAAEGLELTQRPFSVAEAKAAREVFLTASTAIVMPVVKIDGVPVGNGTPGLIAGRLRSAYVKLGVVE
jgi:D-alanine transaminase